MSRVYRIAGEKFGKFGESSVIRQTKTIQISTYNYYLMAESIHSPNLSLPNAHNSEFAKLSCYTVKGAGGGWVTATSR